MSLEDKRICKCVTKHVPLPMYWKKALVQGEYVILCPTTYANLELLLSLWADVGGEPPGWERKHFSDYVQTLAKKSLGV